MANGPKIRGESLRGWIAIFLVTLGGLAASFHSYYMGRADVLVIQTKIDAIEKKALTLEKKTGSLADEVVRLTTIH